MIAWIRRARQTRTQVDSPGAMQRERDAGLRLAFRVLGAMQLTTQLLLWTIQFGYDHLRQTTWQAAVFLTVPTLLLWLLWRRACRGGLEGGRRYWALLLLPNLCLDAGRVSVALLFQRLQNLFRQAKVGKRQILFHRDLFLIQSSGENRNFFNHITLLQYFQSPSRKKASAFFACFRLGCAV